MRVNKYLNWNTIGTARLYIVPASNSSWVVSPFSLSTCNSPQHQPSSTCFLSQSKTTLTFDEQAHRRSVWCISLQHIVQIVEKNNWIPIKRYKTQHKTKHSAVTFYSSYDRYRLLPCYFFFLVNHMKLRVYSLPVFVCCFFFLSCGKRETEPKRKRMTDCCCMCECIVYRALYMRHKVPQSAIRFTIKFYLKPILLHLHTWTLHLDSTYLSSIFPSGEIWNSINQWYLFSK